MVPTKLFDIFGSFLKNRVKATSLNQFGQKRKFLYNEKTHLHTKFHEDLMKFNRFNKSLKKIIDAKMATKMAKMAKFQLFLAIFSVTDHQIFMKFCVKVCLLII